MPSSPAWHEPTSAHGVRWQGFLMSDPRGDSSNRRKAKCSYCNEHFSNGKPSGLYNHVKNVCPSIPSDKKASYLQAVHAATSDSDHRPFRSSSSSLPQKRPSSAQASSPHYRAISKDKAEELHELLLKSLIASDTSLWLLENEHFQEYQRQLARSNYKIPTVTHMLDVVVPVMFAKYEIELLNRLQNQRQLTLSLDSWTDLSGNTVYALLIQRGNFQLRQLIDILEFSQGFHTPHNILEAIKRTLQQKDMNWTRIASVVSHSSAIMAQLGSLIQLEFPHVLGLSCGLHAFNLMAKEIIAHPLVEPIVEANKTLINFFVTSPYWSDHLNAWAASNQITTYLDSAFESRWYSMAAVCLIVQDYEQGFQNALALDLDTTTETPSIKATVQRIIMDPHHFLANRTVNLLIRPLVDSIGRLQRDSTTIGDIWPELASLHRAFTQTDLKYGFFETFKHHCQAALHKHSRVFASNEIYLVGFFLSPAYRRVSVSLKYTLEDITRAVVLVAKAWEFTLAEAIAIKTQVSSYYHDEPAFKAQPAVAPYASSYWSSLPTTPENQALRRLAVALFDLVPHATGIETLYPIKTSVTSYKLPQMPPSTRKMMSHLKYDLQYAHPNLETLRDPTDSVKPFDVPFQSLTELANFENGAFGSGYDDPVTSTVVEQREASIESLFDLNVFAHIQLDTVDQQDIIVPQPVSVNWTVEDVLGPSG